jgi:hypothetical protein
MTTNNLDTIEMTRRIRDAQYEQIKDKPLIERLAFYRDKAQAFHRQLGIKAPGAAPAEPGKAIALVANDEGHQHHDS